MTSYLTIRTTPSAPPRRFDPQAFASFFVEDEPILVRATPAARIAKATLSYLTKPRAVWGSVRAVSTAFRAVLSAYRRAPRVATINA